MISCLEKIFLSGHDSALTGFVKWVESGQGTNAGTCDWPLLALATSRPGPRVNDSRPGWWGGGGHRHYSIPLVVRSHSHSSLPSPPHPTTLRDSSLFKPFITHLWFPMLASLLVTALWNAWFLNHVLDRINSFFNRFVLQLLYVVWKYITIKLIKKSIEKYFSRFWNGER